MSRLLVADVFKSLKAMWNIENTNEVDVLVYGNRRGLSPLGLLTIYVTDLPLCTESAGSRPLDSFWLSPTFQKTSEWSKANA